MDNERVQILHQSTPTQSASLAASFKHLNPPKESDTKGTAFRIRPQTPKLNLLNYQKDKIKGRK